MQDTDQAAMLNEEFLLFRETFINELLSIATFKEKRGEHFIRPLVIVKDREKFEELNAKVNQWERYVEEIVELDPIRYNTRSVKFKLPAVLRDMSSVSIYINEAVSVRDVSKEQLISNYETAIASLKVGEQTEDSKRTCRIYRNEMNAIKRDDETMYKARNSNHTDVVVHFLPTLENGEKAPSNNFIKHRVSMAGMIVFDEIGNMECNLPKDGASRKSLIDTYITPIKYSIPSRGKIYRSSDNKRALTEMADKERVIRKRKDADKYNAKRREKRRLARVEKAAAIKAEKAAIKAEKAAERKKAAAAKKAATAAKKAAAAAK